jgi:hypothetical protein
MIGLIKGILFLALCIFVFAIVGIGINYFEDLVSGPQYCFNDVSQQEIELIFRSTGIKYTSLQGDSICFRTHDFNKVTTLNQQIQDRKYQEKIAEIESAERQAKANFPFIILGIIAIFAIIIIALILNNKNSYNRGIW